MSWYFSQNLKPQGPFTLVEIRQKIHRGEVGPQDLMLNEETGEWKPALSWRVFEAALFPALQDVQEGPQAEGVDWVLLRGQQEGPYSTRKLRQMLQAHEVTGDHSIWKTGLSGWVRLRDRPEFQEFFMQKLRAKDLEF